MSDALENILLEPTCFLFNWRENFENFHRRGDGGGGGGGAGGGEGIKIHIKLCLIK